MYGFPLIHTNREALFMGLPVCANYELKSNKNDDSGLYMMLYTVKLLNNGHPFCRGLVAVVDECPLVRGCRKMSTNPRVWRGQGRLINTKLVPRSFRPTKKLN